ncbi:hypothetical protein [Lonsdalea quercina]
MPSSWLNFIDYSIIRGMLNTAMACLRMGLATAMRNTQTVKSSALFPS